MGYCMSSHSYSVTCPNCGENADAMEDSREGSFVWCPGCGYTKVPAVSQCPLDELNERRAQWNEIDEGEYPQLDHLPDWKLA